MAPALYLLAFALFWKSASGVLCYKCVAELSYAADEHRCEHFDASDRFVVDCLNSTMCYKRLTVLHLDNGLSSESQQRGCAQQSIHGDQKKVNNKWVQVHDIHEVYAQGCRAEGADGERVTRTTHCYCYGALCNGSPPAARPPPARLLPALLLPALLLPALPLLAAAGRS